MRKLYEATGGQPQRWESLGSLGAIKADAAGITYAVERDWLIISGGLHTVSLTDSCDSCDSWRPPSGPNLHTGHLYIGRLSRP
jgi:hypothetical protein